MFINFFFSKVNLIFVCCQPNLHAQISTKALGKYIIILNFFILKRKNFFFINYTYLRYWKKCHMPFSYIKKYRGNYAHD